MTGFFVKASQPFFGLLPPPGRLKFYLKAAIATPCLMLSRYSPAFFFALVLFNIELGVEGCIQKTDDKSSWGRQLANPGQITSTSIV